METKWSLFISCNYCMGRVGLWDVEGLVFWFFFLEETFSSAWEDCHSPVIPFDPQATQESTGGTSLTCCDLGMSSDLALFFSVLALLWWLSWGQSVACEGVTTQDEEVCFYSGRHLKERKYNSVPCWTFFSSQHKKLRGYNLVWEQEKSISESGCIGLSGSVCVPDWGS